MDTKSGSEELISESESTPPSIETDNGQPLDPKRAIKFWNFGTITFKKSDGTPVNELQGVRIALIRGEGSPNITCKMQLSYITRSYGQSSRQAFHCRIRTSNRTANGSIQLTTSEFWLSIPCVGKAFIAETPFPLQYFADATDMEILPMEQQGQDC